MADHVEVPFRSSMGNQFRNEVVVTRVRCGSPWLVKDGGEVDLMIKLLLCCPSLPSHARLVSVGAGAGGWCLWSKHRVVLALRQVVASAGLPPAEYALHSLRIGGAKYAAVGGGWGASSQQLRSEGRWAG